MVANMRIQGWDCSVYNISGLSFHAEEVRERAGEIPRFIDRPKSVVYASRFDSEKQPHFLMDVIERSSIPFLIVQGTELKSDDPTALARLLDLNAREKVCIVDNATKAEYYHHLKTSRVLFNCALQDWTSNVVSEADAVGTNVVFPAYRSFPEVFANDHTRLYAPWSVDDAIAKLTAALLNESPNQGLISEWTNGTVGRMLSIMQGEGEQWRRDVVDYRKHVSEAKYRLAS
jgi:hypothetical protein